MLERAHADWSSLCREGGWEGEAERGGGKRGTVGRGLEGIRARKRGRERDKGRGGEGGRKGGRERERERERER